MEYNLKGWTNLDEVNLLVGAGLNPETSDMHFWEADGKLYTFIGKREDINGVPCWSYGRLIDLMPKRIGLFTLVWNISDGVIEYKVDIDSEHTDKLVRRYDIPSLVVWLLENGYMEDITILKDAPFNMYGSIVELYGSSGNDFYVIKEIINDINKNAGINIKV